jgi:precorrin-2 dehydrogenase/sirohydrochlorin ferrochelatase
MRIYPVSLTGLDQRTAVVIGGGKVAYRKVKALLEAGAAITVISPALIPELSILASEHLISVLQRVYQESDLKDAFLVIAATDDPALNRSIWQDALRWKCLVNVVDDPQHSNFILPAVVRRGDFTISISTGGASPALARRVREQLEDQFGREYGELTRLLGELRTDLHTLFETEDERLRAALYLLDSGILQVVRTNGYDAARRTALEKWSEITR